MLTFGNMQEQSLSSTLEAQVNSYGAEVSFISFIQGRADALDAVSTFNKAPIPDGVLPSPTSNADMIRDIFYRMGFK
jgi:hypothetical protein